MWLHFTEAPIFVCKWREISYFPKHMVATGPPYPNMPKKGCRPKKKENQYESARNLLRKSIWIYQKFVKKIDTIKYGGSPPIAFPLIDRCNDAPIFPLEKTTRRMVGNQAECEKNETKHLKAYIWSIRWSHLAVTMNKSINSMQSHM